jgi:hypothetical protein
MVRECSFIGWGGYDTFGGNNVYAFGMTPYNLLVTIWDRGVTANLVVLENGYNGNIQITNTNTSYTYGDRLAPDGFLYIQFASQVFVARNCISNYFLEAVQLNNGPNSLAGNIYYSLVSAPSSCALCLDGPTNRAPINLATCFIGNSVHGGRNGVEDTSAQNGIPWFHTYNCSGNTFNLYPAFIEPYGSAGDYPSVIASASTGCWPNVCGNTLLAGGFGLVYTGPNGNAVILNNNFGATAYRGIGLIANGDSLNQAQFYGNTLGQGVSFHVQVGITNGFGWFIGNNTYLNGSSNIVSPFFDPISAPVHFSP